jgi:hypothetical protein
MLTHPSGLIVVPARPLLGVSPDAGVSLERQRLRQELLKRIIDREVRRQSRRSGPR